MALRRDAKIELLKKVPLFAGCTKGELRQLASIADEIELREGTVLTREGRIGHEFFVLIEGTVRVSKGDRTLAELSGPLRVVGRRGRSAPGPAPAWWDWSGSRRRWPGCSSAATDASAGAGRDPPR